MEEKFLDLCLKPDVEQGAAERKKIGNDVQRGEKDQEGEEQGDGKRQGGDGGQKFEDDDKERDEERDDQYEMDRWLDVDDRALVDDNDEDDKEGDEQMTNKKTLAFTPLVTIIRTTEERKAKLDVRTASEDVPICDVRADVNVYCKKLKPDLLNSSKRRSLCCGELLSSVLSLLAGAVMFPLLVWAGNELLPFEPPVIRSASYRLVYTLRCSLFASIPFVLGVLVYSISRLRFSSVNPLFDENRAKHHSVVHMNFVQDSLRLFLVFFILLSVMSTYVHQEELKLIPLLVIVFSFGRMIYWPLVYFSSSVRAIGFSLSFMPVLVLIGLNLYYTCSPTSEEAVFSVAPLPTTAPPPKPRWWG